MPEKGSARYIYVVIRILFCLVFAGSNLSAQTSDEYQIKAAFLYKFAGYIEWPDEVFTDAGSPLVFGVIGADQLADSLELLVRDRKVYSRPIQVRRLQADTPVTGVHILFVGQSVSQLMEPLLPDVVSRSVLTVTETTTVRSKGSVINFLVVNDKVRFDVSLQPAELGRLQISSRLLQVAHNVINGPP